MPKQKKVFLPSPEIIAEAVNPDAAIEFWKQRAKLTDEEAKALGEEAKYRAFYVTGLAQHDLVQMVSDGIEEALKNGETLNDFKKRILGAIQSQGWHGSRVENIFRTNVQTAYAAGRYTKMQAVKKARPYWQYIAIMDSRVRPSHAVMNGKVYPADHAFWNSNYPPNGFRCRCGVRSLSARQVKDMGLKVETELPKTGGADKGFQNNPGYHWAETGLDLKQYGLQNIAPPKPKKEPVTQKKLAADIASIDELIKKSAGLDVSALEAKKEELTNLLEKKKHQAEQKKLNSQKKKIDKQIEDYPVKTYTGIWKDAVTTTDWKEKSGNIWAKKQYFEDKLQSTDLTPEEETKFKVLLQDLEEFDSTGQKLNELLEKQENIQSSLAKLKNGGKEKPNPYSDSRKAAALWAKTPQEADDVLRKPTGKIWQEASEEEKDAIFAYTQGSGGFNRPLRGYDGDWDNFKGVGSVDLDNEGRASDIKRMTELIDRSSYDRDIWLQRGVETDAGIAGFLGISEESLYRMPWDKLKKLLEGRKTIDHGFVSCGSASGKGFKGHILRIYCPKGTKMMYAEPFSHYGDGDKRDWDGEKTQTSFGNEDETIIQRETKFRIIHVERNSFGYLSLEVEVIKQN